MTQLEIKKIEKNSIKSIIVKVGAFAESCILKIMKNNNDIVIITRIGIIRYLGNADYAFFSGQKNIHYKIFKNSKSAYNYINNEILKYK